MADDKSVISNTPVQNIENPEIILLFSGKRKSGKDYITDKLHEKLGPNKSVIIKISGPIKNHWAQTLNLDIQKLMSDGEYKEKYRSDMIKWSEDIRRQDYGYFCRAAVEMYKASEKPIWIVSDIRRKTDIQWFNENYGQVCKTIRISCSDDTRKKRGWTFSDGIDNAESECDLDDITGWNLNISNENENIEKIIESIMILMK